MKEVGGFAAHFFHPLSLTTTVIASEEE